MGDRGPAKKPAALKRLEGTYRADRDAGFEPPVEVPDPPKHWKKRSVERSEWDRMTPWLAEHGLIAQCDLWALAMYCEAVSRVVRFRAIVEKDGEFLVNIKGQLYRHPALAEWTGAQADVVSWAKQFGFTPSSRSNVKGGKARAKGNPFAELPKGGNVTPFSAGSGS